MQIRRSVAIVIGILILVAGAALALGLTSWAGRPVLGSSHAIPVYVSQAAGAGTPIEQINRQPVNSISDYQRLVAQAGKQPLVLLINRKGRTAFLVVQPE
jgi:hypothetical protein